MLTSSVEMLSACILYFDLKGKNVPQQADLLKQTGRV